LDGRGWGPALTRCFPVQEDVAEMFSESTLVHLVRYLSVWAKSMGRSTYSLILFARPPYSFIRIAITRHGTIGPAGGFIWTWEPKLPRSSRSLWLMRHMCRRHKGRPPRHVRVSNGPKILPDNIGAAPAVRTYSVPTFGGVCP
jgi:hypothetical protein